MRARMALKYANIDVEIREISLRDKPAHLLQISPKATVPVLGLVNGTVIDESLSIMHWALTQSDQSGWLLGDKLATVQLINENDTTFKRALDAYKYPERHPEKSQLEYRLQGELFLQKLENLLEHRQYLMASHITLADVAIFPFVRQFAAVDANWFERSSYPSLKQWLNSLVTSSLFVSIMQKRPTYVE